MLCQTGRCTHQGHALPTRVCRGLRSLRAQVLETNRRVQAQNNAPPDFPAFVRQGFDIKVLADGYSVDSKGLIYKVRPGAAARRAGRAPRWQTRGCCPRLCCRRWLLLHPIMRQYAAITVCTTNVRVPAGHGPPWSALSVAKFI